MKSVYIILLLAVISSVGCKKVQLEPDTANFSGDPLFFAEISVDGHQTNYTVGENVVLNSTYVDAGTGSQVSSLLLNQDGSPLMMLEFALPDHLNVNSFNTPITFDTSFDHSISINDLLNGPLITIGAWHLMGQNTGHTLHITEYGEYDVALEINEFQGTQYSFLLKDKLVVGGTEQYEPEINVSEDIGTATFTFTLTNVPPHVDQIVWYTGSDYFGNKQLFDPIAGITVLPGLTEVVTCEFYAQGELVNYKSKMVDGSFSSLEVDLSTALSDLSASEMVLAPEAKVTFYHNGDSYSINSGLSIPSNYTITNVHSTVESVTGHEYIVATMIFNGNLYNNMGEMIQVVFYGDIGFIKGPE